jgi:putative thiazole-containing bacteriocin maturation protein
MPGILASTRLKVNQDTYYIPDRKGGIYFRNNSHSFRMHGSNVYQWMEKLLPIFDGGRTLQEITEGLPEDFQQRVYEFAEILLENGYARDISTDEAHTLAENIQKKYQAQIDYLDHLSGSGAHRFEKYRQSSVLAIGSGDFLTTLISALLQSGLEKIHMIATKHSTASMNRISQLLHDTKLMDSGVSIVPISYDSISGWNEIVSSFDTVLYVGEEKDVDQMILLEHVCKKAQKCFLPAIILHDTGMVGPAIDFQSAYQRVSFLKNNTNKASSTSLCLLANQLAFLWFQIQTGIVRKNKPTVFLLDLVTLEGRWHSFQSLPHLDQTNQILKALPKEKWNDSPIHKNGNLPYLFQQITSSRTGIFRSWGPENHLQLPLSQCQVIVSNPLSAESTETLTPIICAGWNHQEAQRESGLAGIEAYGSQLIKGTYLLNNPSTYIGIGAGESNAEAICRGLQKHLTHFLKEKNASPTLPQYRLSLNFIEDEKSRYYVKSIRSLYGLPTVSIGEPIFGFPVVWIKTGSTWFASVGFHLTAALRNALQKALQMAQNDTNKTSALHTNKQLALCTTLFPSYQADSYEQVLSSVLPTLEQHNQQIDVFSICMEKIIDQHLSVVGVMLREEQA